MNSIVFAIFIKLFLFLSLRSLCCTFLMDGQKILKSSLNYSFLDSHTFAICYLHLLISHRYFCNSTISTPMVYSLVFPLRRPCPKVIKLVSCSTQMSTKIQLLIKTKIPTNEEVYCFKFLRCCIYPAHKC